MGFFLAAAALSSSPRSKRKAELLSRPRRLKAGFVGAEMVTEGLAPEAVEEAVTTVEPVAVFDVVTVDEVFSDTSVCERAPVFWQA